MPVVSEFEGIEICLYFDEHLPPHFHAKYAGQEACWNKAKNMELPAKINPLK